LASGRDGDGMHSNNLEYAGDMFSLLAQQHQQKKEKEKRKKRVSI